MKNDPKFHGGLISGDPDIICPRITNETVLTNEQYERLMEIVNETKNKEGKIELTFDKKDMVWILNNG
jgi:hypothetical protein